MDCESGSPFTPVSCPTRHWSCVNSDLCIPDKWICDGHDDCPGGSDESNCTLLSECPGFRCINHECIPTRWRCDEIADCQDDSDELDCAALGSNHTHHSCDRDSGFFQCSSGECIDHDKVCDGEKVCVILN